MNKKQLIQKLEKLPLDAQIEFRLNEQPIMLRVNYIYIVHHSELKNVKKGIIDLVVDGIRFDLD